MTRPGLAGDELAELRDLIGGADSVELKLTVPESDQRSAVQALGMDPIQARGGDPPIWESGGATL